MTIPCNAIKEPLLTDEQGVYAKMTNAELVELCKQNDRVAWNEFFRRFIPTITNTISRALKNSKLVKPQHRDDIIWDIHEKLVIKLYRDKKIKECSNPDGIVAFIQTMSKHETIDWLLAQGRQCRFPQRDFELYLRSLNASLKINKDGSKLTLENVVVSESLDTKGILKIVEHALSVIQDIRKEKVRWVFRLCMLGYLPIEDEEIEEIVNSTVCSCTFSEVKQQIEAMTLEVENKERNRIKAEGQFVQYTCQVNWIEQELKEKLKSYSPQQNELTFASNAKIRKEIKQLALRRRDLKRWRLEKYRQSRALSKPSQKLIAHLMGIPENKANQISNIFERESNRIYSKIKNNP